MASRMDEFRDFVARYPGIKDDVLMVHIHGKKYMKIG